MTAPSSRPPQRISDTDADRAPGKAGKPGRKADRALAHPDEPTRSSRANVMLALGVVALVVVLVFILQNLESVKVSFFTAHWHMPLGISLLLAAALGALIAFGAGSLRIRELRRMAKHQALRADQAGRH